MKVQLVCPHCGSDDIACDAAAVWNFDKQEWVLAGTHDRVTCQACERDEIEPKEQEVNTDDWDAGQQRPCPGHKWVFTGAAYGGDEAGEGRAYCEHCGADGDA